MSSPKSFICMDGVQHGYDGKIVLGAIDLSINEGEFVTIVGPSGCGKSTLLRLLLGAERPLTGTITIAGAAKTKPDRQCGIVYQQYAVFPHLSVTENILFGLRENGQATAGPFVKSNYSDLAEQYIKQMGLEDARDKYPYQLSGGMEQRVAIAQALAVHPPILLLDEPFSALDSWRREQLQLLLLELYKKEKMTVVFVTHDLKEAVYLGTRVIVLTKPHGINPGAIAAEGAKIILDEKIDYPFPRPGEFKTSAEFNKMVARIGKVVADGSV